MIEVWYCDKCNPENKGEEMSTKTKQEYKLEIKPALEPEERHKIEDVLKKMGYDVWAGGTCTDMSSCDISFRAE